MHWVQNPVKESRVLQFWKYSKEEDLQIRNPIYSGSNPINLKSSLDSKHFPLYDTAQLPINEQPPFSSGNKPSSQALHIVSSSLHS